ncbi:flavodoxin domain-containing protein [Cellulomonas wangsupingiae]|uniref:Flavodoxin domain-containing protein n=1 Tax=Cellulomonas wangsupingiae TaxID=2968085 RepID=A0ABY5K2E0_9CELL|nr:flavodoxin domain-containing protein [Cellulomonas wangsupingiae]MCC2335735.1 flavodoxin domain-containing protein [Cellulomonas wangsupingiae]MCM0641112.1 flavodoxin domain-containing protein [Cellulomonas wangsupingiae]UUI63969.1 flavodoxin domain-containing protein [Cellulomonas wangsupingiae]
MRILLAVASRHQGTWEIGDVVAQRLRARGHEVDQSAPEDVTTVAQHDAVVLGSAVYTAHWLPAARDLADRCAQELRARPVWTFSSGLATQPANSANSPLEVAALCERIGARGHRSFRGRLDRSVLSFTERAIIAGGRAREGDHRDMEAVAAWADTIADALDAEPCAGRSSMAGHSA